MNWTKKNYRNLLSNKYTASGSQIIHSKASENINRLSNKMVSMY